MEELVITDTSHDILQVILRYLYELADENPVGEGAFVTEETAVEVLITAEKYGLDTLKLWCEKLIVEVMEVPQHTHTHTHDTRQTYDTHTHDTQHD
jgi:hypothetical protein